MSEIEQKIYEFIVGYTMKHLYSPNVQEICENVGRNKGVVWGHLRKIEKAGLIELPEYATPRAIHLVGFKLIPIVANTEKRGCDD